MNGTSGGGGRSRTFPDQAVENLLLVWIFAIGWSVASLVVVTPLVRQALQTHNLPALLALVFPVAGLGMILWAVRRSLRIRKFGYSVFHLDSGYVAAGGDLEGTIHVAHRFEGDNPAHLRLLCLKRIRSSGQRKRTTDRVVWQKSLEVNPLPPSGDGSDIKVKFDIPADAQPSTGFDWNGEILWRLEARRSGGFIGYFARFQIPLLAVAPQDPAPSSQEAQSPVHSTGVLDPRSRLNEPGITCQPLSGGLHIHLAAARRKPIIPTVVGLILLGAAIGLFVAPAPGVLRIGPIAIGCVFLVVGGLFSYIAFYQWLVSQDVTVRHGTLVVEIHALLLHRSRTFAAGDLTGIHCKIDGSSSSGNSKGKSKTTTSFGIQLKTREGQSNWIANNISNINYANWLAEQINQYLGLPINIDEPV